ncbi:hypothetical protein R1flu_025508 [Riccia fluitans]|uniref:Uncharacterized protein n=1 Tax=Riccia fluitans TaxID=41844 RepID=A0ABD1Y0X5_9MARC
MIAISPRGSPARKCIGVFRVSGVESEIESQSPEYFLARRVLRSSQPGSARRSGRTGGFPELVKQELGRPGPDDSFLQATQITLAPRYIAATGRRRAAGVRAQYRAGIC